MSPSLIPPANPRRPRIDYVVNARLPTEKAHGLQVMRQCEAFVAVGAEVRLYHALRFQSTELQQARRQVGGGRGRTDPFTYYDTPRTFPARALPTADLQIPLEGFVGERARRGLFLLQSASFAGWAPLQALAGDPDRWIYTRDLYHAAALAALGAGSRTIFEAHRHPASSAGLYTRILGRLAGVVCITAGLRDLLQAAGLPSERLLVAADGVRLSDFSAMPARRAARTALGLDPDRPLAVYTGHLFGWKGVDALVLAARELPEIDVLVLGGLQRDQQSLIERTHPGGNVHLRGHVPPEQVPPVLAAADVLVLPSSGHAPEGRTYTSPMKLFEYMAAGRAIVASDLPSLREVLEPEVTALMPPADDLPALAAAIRRLAADPNLASRLATQAQQAVQAYTWERRAQKILAWLAR